MLAAFFSSCPWVKLCLCALLFVKYNFSPPDPLRLSESEASKTETNLLVSRRLPCLMRSLPTNARSASLHAAMLRGSPMVPASEQRCWQHHALNGRRIAQREDSMPVQLGYLASAPVDAGVCQYIMLRSCLVLSMVPLACLSTQVYGRPSGHVAVLRVLLDES